MPLPRPDGKVGPSNDVVSAFDPDTLCHAVWGSVTSSAWPWCGLGTLARRTASTRTWAGLRALHARGSNQEQPEDLRMMGAMRTTTRTKAARDGA